MEWRGARLPRRCWTHQEELPNIGTMERIPEPLGHLAKRYGVRDLYVFGSRAAEIAARVRGRSTSSSVGGGTSSDVDVAVEPLPQHTLSARDRVRLADELERTIVAAGPGTVAAFVAEPIVGATLAAAAPPDDYWPLIAEVCRRHGVLLVADEVMTGFGRTGRWFGIDHWGGRPDLLVAAKGATSGYWPFGFVAASGAVHDAVAGEGASGFIHGFTFSHHAVGAAVAAEVLRILEAEDLLAASETKGDRLRAMLGERLGEHPNVGEIRGRGLMVGLELVAERETHETFPRAAKVTEAVVRAAKSNGVLVYSGTGLADGTDGDSILLGPPFVVTDPELDRIVEVLGDAIDAVATEVGLGASASGLG